MFRNALQEREEEQSGTAVWRGDVGMAAGAPTGKEGPTILCIGNDESLLAYRRLVLMQAGYHIITARPHQDRPHQYASLVLLHNPELVIACHSLSPTERITLAEEIRDQHSGTRLLALTSGNVRSEEARLYDWQMDTLDGSAALIQYVRNHM